MKTLGISLELLLGILMGAELALILIALVVIR